jgi:hypothetical protein
MTDALDQAGEEVARVGDHEGVAAHSPSDRWALVVFLIAELVALIVFMVLARHMWFATDEWEFLAGRTAFNLGDLFRPHFDHWVTLPVLAYRGLWSIFGLRTYRPYQLSIVLLHLTAGFLVRAIMRRVGVRPWTATAVASIFVFLGTDFLNIVSPFQITIVGSLVFGLTQMLVVTHDEGIGRRDLWGLAAGCAALMCSGVGVAMVIAVGVAVLMLRGWRPALLQTVPLGLLYLIWYAVIGHQRPPGSVGYDANIGDVGRFVTHLVSVTFSAIGHYRGVGAVLAVLLGAGLALAWVPLGRAGFRREAAIPVGLLVGAVAFMCVTAVGRSGLGDLGEFGNRYLTIVTAMVLPAVGVAADAVMRRWRVTIPFVIALLLIGIPANVNGFARFARQPAMIDTTNRFRQLILSLPHVPVAAEVPSDVVPDPDGFTFQVTIGWLRAGAASGRIPRPRYISPEQRTMDALRLSFRQSIAGPERTDVCAGLQKPLVFHFRTGDHIVIGSANGDAQIEPIGLSVRGTLPFRAITLFGPTYVAVRPVAFRLKSLVKQLEIVCAAPGSFAHGIGTFPAYRN